MWRALRREGGGLTLDLVYGPQAWRCGLFQLCALRMTMKDLNRPTHIYSYNHPIYSVLREHCWPAAAAEDVDAGAWRLPFDEDSNSTREYTALMYIHTGGLEGLASQLGRYRRLGLLEPGEEEGIA